MMRSQVAQDMARYRILAATAKYHRQSEDYLILVTAMYRVLVTARYRVLVTARYRVLVTATYRVLVTARYQRQYLHRLSFRD